MERIDAKNKKYKEYTSYFGIKKGDWSSFDKYPYIAILRKNITSTAYSRAHIPSSTSKKTYYDICLLNRTHRQKVIINRLNGKEQALIGAKELAERLNVELATYNPVISETTKAT